MSTERDLINLSGTPASKVVDDIEAEKKEFIAKAAMMLDRGWTNARINVPLPPEKYGEWVHDSAVDIARMQALGFKIDTEYAAKQGLHSDGSDRPKIGDVVFMVTDRWRWEMLQKMKADRVARRFDSKYADAPTFETDVIPVTNRSTQELKDSQGLATSISEDINIQSRQIDSYNGAAGA